MFTTIKVLGAAALIAGSHAHMIMNTPTPYGLKSLVTSPLNGEGYNFPCQTGTRTDAFDAEGASNPMTVGQDNDLKFTGSAVHGGGSCQLSVTYDYPPPADKTKWKVVHSFIGSCPASAAGNLQGTGKTDAQGRPEGPECTSDTQTECLKDFKWQLPSGMKNGNATLAWTWFNKVGNREMYMNCAPISISGGSDDETVFNSLPDMFVANIPGECTTEGSGGVIGFPEPGSMVTYGEAITSGAQGSCPAAGSGGSSSSSESSAATSSAEAASTASSMVAYTTTAVTSVASAALSAESATSTADSAAATAASPTYSTGSLSGTNNTSSSGASSSGTSSGTCPSGYVSCSSTVVCSADGTQFGLCGEDNCAVLQDVSAGTSCKDGTVARRSIRAHRHVAHSHRKFY